jgi:hypothetical protein
MPLSNLTPGGSMLVRKSYAEGSMLVRTDSGDSFTLCRSSVPVVRVNECARERWGEPPRPSSV